VSAIPAVPTRTASESAIQIDRVTKRFGRILAVDDLSLCGLNVPRLDNVSRTVDFAIAMQRIIDRFNAETANHLELRAGIDTGTVTSGLVGRSSLAYDMWGAAVNLASRVQSGSPHPGICVTTQVYDAMRDSRHFTAAGEITANGAQTPIWRLTDRQP
jgi:class 3 adenylate cyclase